MKARPYQLPLVIWNYFRFTNGSYFDFAARCCFILNLALLNFALRQIRDVLCALNSLWIERIATANLPRPTKSLDDHGLN